MQELNDVVNSLCSCMNEKQYNSFLNYNNRINDAAIAACISTDDINKFKLVVDDAVIAYKNIIPLWIEMKSDVTNAYKNVKVAYKNFHNAYIDAEIKARKKRNLKIINYGIKLLKEDKNGKNNS